jgi:hypothetical protein
VSSTGANYAARPISIKISRRKVIIIVVAILIHSPIAIIGQIAAVRPYQEAEQDRESANEYEPRLEAKSPDLGLSVDVFTPTPPSRAAI